MGFTEKPREDGIKIKGGFFVFSPKWLEFIDGDQTYWEESPPIKLTEKSELMAFTYYVFLQPMDKSREKNLLEGLWQKKQAPWKIW